MSPVAPRDPTPQDETAHPARILRNLVEPIAAAVYFAPEATEEYKALGLNYFEGYFTSRGACLGRAPWTVICAAFAAFKPSAVERAVTQGWDKTTPELVLAARARAAEAQLTRLLGPPDGDLERATAILRDITDGVDRSGRMLFAGLSARPWPGTPMGDFSHAADLAREHRGDGHIAAWIPHVDSCEVTVLTELYSGMQPRTYVFTRGYDNDDVDAAYTRLTDRGLLDADGALTGAGRELRTAIEAQTDRTEREVMERLGDRTDELFALLAPRARAVVNGGGYPADPASLGTGSR